MGLISGEGCPPDLERVLTHCPQHDTDSSGFSSSSYKDSNSIVLGSYPYDLT